MPERSVPARSAAPRRRAGLLLAALFTLLLVPASPASSQATPQASLSTPWPSMEVESGNTTRITVTVASSPPGIVEVRVAEVPDDWRARLRASATTVHAVTAGEGDDAVDLNLLVDASSGATIDAYTVVVAATGEDGVEVRMPIELHVTNEAGGVFTLDTDFPSLSGDASSTFRWSLELANDLFEETSFNFGSTAPEGWTVRVFPRGQRQATSLSLPALETSTIDVEATAPPGVEAGEYPITAIVYGDGREREVQLTAIVEGVLSYNLRTGDERLNTSGSIGRVTRLPLLVVNDGSMDLDDVRLESDPPAGWEVTFEPAQLPRVGAREQAEVVALITPSDAAIAGDYAVGLSARSGGHTRDIEVRFQVSTPMSWALVGVVLIGVAVLILAVVFRVYGRR